MGVVLRHLKFMSLGWMFSRGPGRWMSGGRTAALRCLFPNALLEFYFLRILLRNGRSEFPTYLLSQFSFAGKVQFVPAGKDTLVAFTQQVLHHRRVFVGAEYYTQCGIIARCLPASACAAWIQRQSLFPVQARKTEDYQPMPLPPWTRPADEIPEASGTRAPWDL